MVNHDYGTTNMVSKNPMMPPLTQNLATEDFYQVTLRRQPYWPQSTIGRKKYEGTGTVKHSWNLLPRILNALL
jgi:hypothetical protein